MISDLICYFQKKIISGYYRKTLKTKFLIFSLIKFDYRQEMN
jgi:hypothetical protein